MAKTTALEPLNGSVTVNLDQINATLGNLILGQASTVLAANTLEVVDPESLDTAGALVKQCADGIKTVEAACNPYKDRLWKSHKAVVAAINHTIKPWEDSRDKLETKMKAYRKEDKQLTAQSNAEAIRKTEELKKKLLQEAKAFRLKGDISGAKQLEEQANSLVAPLAMDQKVSIEGVHEREPWKAYCGNPMALIKAIADGKYPLMHTIKVRGGGEQEIPILEVNEQVLRFYAKQDQKNFNVPGCSAEQDLEFATRG